MVFLITFVRYGRHLHGSESGSVDREHNVPGSPLLGEESARARAEWKRMDQAPYNLDAIRRAVVLEAIQEVCGHQAWDLLAAHVRSSHVHAVVAAEIRPERVMNAFKAYASRRLTRMGLDEPDRKRWARHGSTRWLWKPEQVSAAIQYLVAEQGEVMSVFQSPTRQRGSDPSPSEPRP
jgi:REP element-mobilizing transposase RayT